jgi:hypothetical protein
MANPLGIRLHREVKENKEIGVVTVGDQKVFGCLEEGPCEGCESKFVYYERYDALHCAQYNEWRNSDWREGV